MDTTAATALGVDVSICIVAIVLMVVGKGGVVIIVVILHHIILWSPSIKPRIMSLSKSRLKHADYHR